MTEGLRFELIGDDFQAVVITLEPSGAIRGDPGSMMYR